jgi:CubicO group peptidase (beta-lactamase class C family)
MTRPPSRRAPRGLALASALTLCAIASASLPGTARAETASPGAVDDVRAYLHRLEKLGVAGVFLIARNGDPVLAEGIGLADRERGTRWTPGTVSTIGSITKQFTGAAILLLVKEGRLSVQDPITKYFDGVPEDKRAVTLHQLLTHSSGIGDLAGADDWDPIGREEFVRRALAQPLSFPPGTSYEYSNAGYSLLGAIIEKLRGGPYERFVRERLFLPQGMYETGYLLPSWGDGRIAQGYRNGERWGTVLERPMAEDGPYWVLRGNGGIHTTAYDMLRWGEALRGGRVLPPGLMEQYWAPHVSEGGDSHYGYGWSIQTVAGAKVITHNGGNGIFFADMAIVPSEGLVIYLATNVASEQPIVYRLLEQIGHRVLADEPLPSVPDRIDVPQAKLTALVGTYALPEGAGALAVAAPDGRSLRIEPSGPHAFARLLSTKPADLARSDRLSARTDAVLAAIFRGDLGPLHDAYGGKVPL